MARQLEETAGQVHLWPWSVGIKTQSMDLGKEEVGVPFLGSPVVSLEANTDVFLPSRMEQFIPLGASFLAGEPQRRIFETPHGVLAGGGPLENLRLRFLGGRRLEVGLTVRGAAKRYEGLEGRTESRLAQLVRAWSQVFDDLLEAARRDLLQRARLTGQGAEEVRWSQVLDVLDEISDPNEPHMALIVEIARQLHRQIESNIGRIRRVLVRQDELLPLHRAREMNRSSLLWLSRQPGEGILEKAGSKQRVLAVARRESFDTLENRVLKDFVIRCKREASRYIREVRTVGRWEASSRARRVLGFGNTCSRAESEPVLQEVKLPEPGARPNYVLQGDPRYRRVWFWYRKLLRRESAEDKVWEWQSRAWADVVRLLMGAALEMTTTGVGTRGNLSGDLHCQTLATSLLRVREEQEAGGRIVPGSLPGPFLWSRRRKGGNVRRAVLELVHPALAHEHESASVLARTGAHLYMVFSSLSEKNPRKNVIAIWAVNTAGSEEEVSLDSILESAEEALTEHRNHLNSGASEPPELHGFVLANRLVLNDAVSSTGKHHRTRGMEIPADPKRWHDAVLDLASTLEQIVREIL